MTDIYKPPQRINLRPNQKSIFLAGSIEMGKAEDWQSEFCRKFVEVDTGNTAIFNPRRDDWDSSWEQKLDHPQFREQVEWELHALERASLIFMNFVPGTQSPISMLELGLYARSGKVLVHCPEGFWRKGNVDVLCAYYGIPMLNIWPALWPSIVADRLRKL